MPEPMRCMSCRPQVGHDSVTTEGWNVLGEGQRPRIRVVRLQTPCRPGKSRLSKSTTCFDSYFRKKGIIGSFPLSCPDRNPAEYPTFSLGEGRLESRLHHDYSQTSLADLPRDFRQA